MNFLIFFDRLTNHLRGPILDLIHLMEVPVVLPQAERSRPSCGSRATTWVRSPASFRPRQRSRPPWRVMTITSMTVHVTPDPDLLFTIWIRHILAVRKSFVVRVSCHIVSTAHVTDLGNLNFLMLFQSSKFSLQPLIPLKWDMLYKSSKVTWKQSALVINLNPWNRLYNKYAMFYLIIQK